MRKKLLFCLALLPCAVFGALVINPNLNPFFPKLADATADFSANQNPNGVWIYGWSEDLTGTVKLFPRSSNPNVNNGLEVGWDDPQNSAGFTPSVAVNAGGDFTDGNVTLSAGTLVLHPCGSDGHAYSHVIWTAPAKGVYFLNASFFAQQNGIDVDVHILVNQKTVFNELINQNSTIRTFTHNFILARGDRLDFTVGPDGNYTLHPGNTGLQVVILRQN